MSRLLFCKDNINNIYYKEVTAPIHYAYIYMPSDRTTQWSEHQQAPGLYHSEIQKETRLELNCCLY